MWQDMVHDIRDQRRSLGLSQVEAAAKAGVSPNTYEAIERGEARGQRADAAEDHDRPRAHLGADDPGQGQAQAVAVSAENLFDLVFCRLPHVHDVFCSGSLARKTHKDPIHDVDSVVIFKHSQRPSWAIDGNGSAKAALVEVAATTMELLRVVDGTEAQEVVS